MPKGFTQKTPARVRQAVSLYESGHLMTEIGELFETHPSVISRWLSEAGVTRRPRRDEDKVRQIVQLYEDGHSTSQISRCVGINNGNVWRILVSEGVSIRNKRMPRAELLALRRKAAEEYRAGASLTEVGEILERDAVTILGWLRQEGVTMRTQSEAMFLHHSSRPKSQTTFSIHSRLNRRFPRTGLCETCGRTSELTHYAFLLHPFAYTNSRADYRELCPKCHRSMDASRQKQVNALFTQMAERCGVDPKTLEAAA